MDSSTGSVESPVSPTPEDATILAIARELCHMLGLEASSLSEVLWSDYPIAVVSSSRKIQLRPPFQRISGPMISAHYPILIDNDRTLVLREMMKRRLDAKDWRPLICSSLIFYKQLGKRRNRKKFLVALAPMLAILAFTAASIIVYLILNYALIPIQYLGILVPFGSIVVGSAGAYLARRIDRRQALEADLRTAKLLGKENFTKVLEKIETMRRSDLAQGRQKKWKDFPPFVSSPAARIQNILDLVI